MRKTLKRQALEHILESMKEIEINLKCNEDDETVKVNAEAMKNLAMAYTLVKRGVMLPDDGREFRPGVRKGGGEWEPGNPICPICGKDKFDGLDADIWADWMPNFCPHCGAPMTDKAVDMVMERLEALGYGKDD